MEFLILAGLFLTGVASHMAHIRAKKEEKFSLEQKFCWGFTGFGYILKYPKTRILFIIGMFLLLIGLAPLVFHEIVPFSTSG